MKISKNRVFGFAMVEALVAVSVIGVTFVALYTALSSGFGFVQLARENLRGTQILQEKMETIRLYTWDQITTPGFIPQTFTDNFFATTNGNGGLVYTGAVQIVNAPITEAYSNDLKQVTIQVRWKSGKTLRTREMQTFIGKNGLQSYIY
jgi:Tfp pilus assembly protein PilV